MSNVNFNVLFQSVENLSVQHEKKSAETDNDQLSLKRASALLEGLNGMIGIENMNIRTNGSMLCLSTMIDAFEVQLSLDPSCDLKLRDIQVRAICSKPVNFSSTLTTNCLIPQVLRGGLMIDVGDIVGKCSVHTQPNDTRRALYFIREQLASLQQ
jgi:hypothetical protein